MPIQAQLSREALYGALFRVVQKIATVPPIVTFSRRYVDWQSLPANAQPAIIMLQGEEQAIRRHRGVVTWHLKSLLLYYFQPQNVGNDPASPPIAALDAILDAVERAVTGINPDGSAVAFGDAPTLGGLVNDVFIDGSITYDQVALDQPTANQGLAIIPVTMEVGI